MCIFLEERLNKINLLNRKIKMKLLKCIVKKRSGYASSSSSSSYNSTEPDASNNLQQKWKDLK